MTPNKKAEAAKYLRLAMLQLEAAEERMRNEDLNATYNIGNAKHQIKEALYYVEEAAKWHKIK